MIDLPKQLKTPKLRFVKIREKQKRPFEEGWQEYNNYKYNEKEFQKYLKQSNSYGVLCINGLAILDVEVENKELINKIFMELPKTFTVKSGRGGYHFYYWIPDLDKKIVLTKNGKHYGEVQAGQKAQCVGPGSLHPNGKTYNIDNNTEIKEISFSILDRVIKDYYEKKDKTKFKTINTGLQWDISKLIEPINKMLRQQGRVPLKTKDDVKYSGSHPVEAHGSSTGHNFEIDVDKNTWYCFRCERGGDALSLIAMLEGLTTEKGECIGKNYFRKHKEQFLQAKKIGIKSYQFPDDGRTPNKITIFRNSKIGKNQAFDNDAVDKYLKAEGHIYITIRDETGRQPHIYFYQDGYYKLNGEDIIVNLVQKLFKDYNIPWQRKHKTEFIDYLKTKNIVERDEFIAPRYLINLENGVYNLKTHRLIPHNPKYNFLYKIPWKYNNKSKKLKAPIQKFFETTFGGNKDYIKFTQELFGYCLYSDYNIHGLFYLYGTGGNGKSVWLNLLEAMLGQKNVRNKSISSLMQNRFTAALLYGKLLNTCGELTPTVMRKTDMLKRLTAGDKIEAEFKGKDGFDFKNIAKIITACNTIPPCNDRTDGWYERQYIIPFVRKFRDTKQEDVDLIEKLVTKENMESLLYWSLQGLKRLLKNKRFTYGDKKDKYLMYQGNTKYFVKRHYEYGEVSDYVKVEDIRADYKKWCKKNDIPEDSEESLSLAFRYWGLPDVVRVEEKGKKIYVRNQLKKVS